MELDQNLSLHKVVGNHRTRSYFANMKVTCFFCLIAVIDGLDRLKKENAGARDSIRFLESEFRKGNRYTFYLGFPVMGNISVLAFFEK